MPKEYRLRTIGGNFENLTVFSVHRNSSGTEYLRLQIRDTQGNFKRVLKLTLDHLRELLEK